jgi:hypothetical protein
MDTIAGFIDRVGSSPLLAEIREIITDLPPVDARAFLSSLESTVVQLLDGGPGVVILTLASLGVVLIAWITASALIGLLRIALRGRRTRPNRTERIAGLARVGAHRAEIARALEMPRDAISMLLPGDAPDRSNVPVAARSAGRSWSTFWRRRASNVA